MNEIEKMYENAGIKKKYCGWLDMGDLDCQMQYVTCNSINEWKNAVFSSRFGETEEEPELKYPEFTAEKQLELIKWLGELDILEITRTIREEKAWIISSEYGMSGNVYKHTSRMKSFEETLARLINSLWQDLTEEERNQIKEILQ